MKSPSPEHGRRALLAKHHWLTFLLPLLVFMVVGTLEPTPEPSTGFLAVSYDYYPLVYTLKIALTAAVVVFVLPGYRQFPWRVSPLAVVVGVVGVVVWVGLCRLQLEQQFLAPLLKTVKLDVLLSLGTRPAYNPLEQLADRPALAWGFLAVRFFGLVVVVALIEEFFLRGFLMRFITSDNWAEAPIGQTHWAAVIAATVVPMMMHPAEMLAAAVWFSMVTWLLLRTRNIWDCVVAHATTNLLLGIYVVWTNEWHLM